MERDFKSILLIITSVIRHYRIPKVIFLKTNTSEPKALLVLCKEKCYEAHEAFVKRKVNNLRTAFSRELNKVRQSKGTVIVFRRHICPFFMILRLVNIYC